MTETCSPQGAETVTLDCDLAPLISSLNRLIDQLTPPVPEPRSAEDEARAQADATLAALVVSTRTPQEQYDADVQALRELKPFVDEREEIQAFRRAYDNLEEPLSEFDERMREVTDSASEAFGDFARDVFEDTENVAAAFERMVVSITESLLETFVFQPVTSGIEGLLGNLLDDVLSGGFLDGIFGGGGRKSLAAVADSASAGLAVAGRAGPELIDVRGGARATPLSSTMAELGGGDVVVNVINETGVNARAQTQQNANGGMDVRLIADELVSTGMTGRRSMATGRAVFGQRPVLKER